MKLLFVGDVIGKPGRRALLALLPELVDQHRVDYTVVNIENSAGGFGVNADVVRQLDELPIDCYTTGNHIWDKSEGVQLLDQREDLLRPQNYPGDSPGSGLHLGETASGIKVATINLEGQVFMKPLRSPFEVADQLIESLADDVKVIHGRFSCRGDQREAGDGLSTWMDAQVQWSVLTPTYRRPTRGCYRTERLCSVTSG